MPSLQGALDARGLREVIEIEIRGKPVPAGTLRWNPTTRRMFWSNATDLDPWKQSIGMIARAAGVRPRDAVRLAITFWMPRPKTHKGPEAPHWHSSRPDIDKLLRAVLDALTGVAYPDDSCVVAVQACKVYGPGPGGIQVRIEPA